MTSPIDQRSGDALLEKTAKKMRGRKLTKGGGPDKGMTKAEHPNPAASYDDPYIRHFNILGLGYKFMAFNGGPVSFSIAGGASTRKSFDPPPSEWCDDDDHSRFTDFGYFANAAPVLHAVSNLILEWTWQKRPFLFHFHATDDRKHLLYRRLVERHSEMLTNRYNYYLSGREFHFVRKADVDPAMMKTA